MSIEFRVHGTPAPQGSKRHVGKGRMVEQSEKLMPWREAVVSAIIRAELADLRLDGPLAISITFYLQRPASHSGKRGLLPSAPAYPHKLPDIDKLVRSTFDACTQSGLVVDDARFVGLITAKEYADDEAKGAHICIRQLTPTMKETNA